jgi:hypothetical protein
MTFGMIVLVAEGISCMDVGKCECRAWTGRGFD